MGEELMGAGDGCWLGETKGMIKRDIACKALVRADVNVAGLTHHVNALLLDR